MMLGDWGIKLKNTNFTLQFHIHSQDVKKSIYTVISRFNNAINDVGRLERDGRALPRGGFDVGAVLHL